jgi:hypothetical protein
VTSNLYFTPKYSKMSRQLSETKFFVEVRYGVRWMKDLLSKKLTAPLATVAFMYQYPGLHLDIFTNPRHYSTVPRLGLTKKPAQRSFHTKLSQNAAKR